MENTTSVYIVEDESIVAKDIQNSLRKLGYNVLGISNNGADAIKQIVELEPDIVLMDIMIKGPLTGIDVAEKIKKEIGSALVMPESEQCVLSIKGRSLTNGIPKEMQVNQKQIAEALTEVVSAIAEGVKTALESTAPELSADIVDRGIVMTGGGALLRNLDKVIAAATGVPVFVAENPLNCVVLGTGRALEEMETLRTVLVNAY